jgi:hypothetical protein
MRLNYKIAEVANITELQKHEMFYLLESHYENMYWSDFVMDLIEKQWAILLFTFDNKLVGFSTQLLIMPEDNTEFNNCLVLYSGDTIIAHDYWGSITLPVAFLQLVSMIQTAHPNKKIYWMLISKGLRTYKFLSVFLKEYYPCYCSQTPLFIKDLMRYMGSKKFGKNFNLQKGIIEADSTSQYLKEIYQPEEKSENQVASFFYSSNPGYYKGDELLCLAEISDNNLHPFIKRMVKNYGQ